MDLIECSSSCKLLQWPSLTFLCVSSGLVGDHYGKGKERVVELKNSCRVLGIPGQNVIVISDRYARPCQFHLWCFSDLQPLHEYTAN